MKFYSKLLPFYFLLNSLETKISSIFNSLRSLRLCVRFLLTKKNFTQRRRERRGQNTKKLNLQTT